MTERIWLMLFSFSILRGEKETGGVVRLSTEQPDRLVFEGTRGEGGVDAQNSPYSYPY